ncbi:GNAT family N-acetyltransferase [Kitasatospora sp. NPDC057198]|uniref:GNAT family N-acetyltransferase n=1 Tax=Kitasatospora sp. NPDC057198 TaxID=3346046 RepID=UPI003642CE6A
MTPAEYAAATERREAEVARELGRLMPGEAARERARRETARFLPDGLGTARHHLVAAQDPSGLVVGDAWIGPDPHQAPEAADTAWLYDLEVRAGFRRRGYGSAILAAAEAPAAREGWTALGLNVFGGNEAAVALYRRSGYGVASMSMRKDVRPAR